MRDPSEELDELESAGLRRRLRRIDSPQGARVRTEGRDLLNFSSNDYLGLADDAELKSLYQNHIEAHGAGSGASRLVCGTMAAHLDLEERLADLKGTKAALTFGSGFATATGVIPALCGKDDFVILDKLCHASLIDGAKLSGATLRVFPHNDLDRLASHLRWCDAKRGAKSRVLVITESVFSMAGDRAPLAAICELKNKQGALLLVDEAHAFGVIGPQGRGLAAELRVESQVDLHLGTFSKAMGLSGGYLCASRAIVDLLVNRARSFIYSTAPSPALAATIRDALGIVSGPRGDLLRETLWERIREFNSDAVSAIVPRIFGGNDLALAAAAQLLEAGFLVPAIRYPTVPRGSARLRVTLSAAHRAEDVAALKAALESSAPIRT